jgi:predicted Zn-ribbon and HTH transcriptional regulator
MICPYPNCGYEWTPKIEHPKLCPRCKQRLDTPWKIRNAEPETKEAD